MFKGGKIQKGKQPHKAKGKNDGKGKTKQVACASKPKMTPIAEKRAPGKGYDLSPLQRGGSLEKELSCLPCRVDKMKKK